jgi:hypothetical protein
MSTKKLNLPLPGDLHRAIFAEARAREVEELRRFAREHAGSELDLIPELESAAAERLGVVAACDLHTALQDG